MQKEEIKIGISGGTFDPIHYGHLITAEAIRERFSLHKVIFIPSGMPPHKNIKRVTESEHRYNMICKAISGNPHFEVSRIEIERQGYTYTIDTLTQLKNIYADRASLFFIIGADVVRDLLTWREFNRVFSMCEFIAVLRPGFDKDNFIDEIQSVKSKYSAKIHVVETEPIDISSTLIREKIRDGKSIKNLVPETVEDYIVSNGLYLDKC